jgi:hypothetical protein
MFLLLFIKLKVVGAVNSPHLHCRRVLNPATIKEEVKRELAKSSGEKALHFKGDTDTIKKKIHRRRRRLVIKI